MRFIGVVLFQYLFVASAQLGHAVVDRVLGLCGMFMQTAIKVCPSRVMGGHGIKVFAQQPSLCHAQ